MLQQYETRSNTSPPHTTYRHGVGKKFLEIALASEGSQQVVGRMLVSDKSLPSQIAVGFENLACQTDVGSP